MDSIKQKYSKIINDVFTACRNYTIYNKQHLTESYIKNTINKYSIDNDSDKDAIYDILLESLRKTIRKWVRRQHEEYGEIPFNEDLIEQFGELMIPETFFDIYYAKENNLIKNLQANIDNYFAKYPEAKQYFEMYVDVDPRYDPYIVKTLKCPACNRLFGCSEYLSKLFKTKPKVEWLANMVTHYRHDHLTSWNKCWGPGGGYYRRGWFRNYDDEKSKVNERQKRQIIRQCKQFLIDHNFTVSDFEQLQGTTDETIALAKKYLKDE